MLGRLKRDKVLKWIIIGAVGALIISIILLFIYWWSFPIKWFDKKYVAHTDAIGTFGDFVGGIFGTLFALFGTYLMYLTLRAQRLLTKQTNRIQKDLANKSIDAQADLAQKANEFHTSLEQQNIEAQKALALANEKEAKLQRFNSLFFELLNILNQQRAQLNQSVADAGFDGMNYFDMKMMDLFDSFAPSSDYGRSVKMAADHYRIFYLKNASDIAPFFRTLYRIMDLISDSTIEEEEKRQFAKIIRAQLRESELFLLRYNAMIEYGENFIEYINRYKLLKHLPIMSLMEMKGFKEIVNRAKRSALSLNLIVHDCWKKIYHYSVDRDNLGLSTPMMLDYYAKYVLSVDLSNPQKTILKLWINTKIHNHLTRYTPFYSFTINDFEDFLKFILQEIYKYSNFKQFNSEGYLKFDAYSNVTKNYTEIIAIVQNSRPLNLLHPDWR